MSSIQFSKNAIISFFGCHSDCSSLSALSEAAANASSSSDVVGWSWREVKGAQSMRLDFKHGNAKGCFLAGLVWYEVMTGNDANKTSFVPNGVTEEDARFFRKIAHEAVAGSRRSSASSVSR